MLQKRKRRRRKERKSRNIESLEARQLMAGDVTVAVDLAADTGIGRADEGTVIVAPTRGEETPDGGDVIIANPDPKEPPTRDDVIIANPDPRDPPTGEGGFQVEKPEDGGDLRDVDVAHVGAVGSRSYFVAAVGTGAQYQLSAWNSDGSMTRIGTDSEVTGHDIEVTPLDHLGSTTVTRGDSTTPDFNSSRPSETLTIGDPKATNGLAVDLDLTGITRVGSFLSSWVGIDGNLWVSSKSILSQGTFQTHDNRGFGTNLDLTVLDHAITLTPPLDSDTRTQVVTPILAENTGGQLELRVVTWSVDHESLLVSGQKISEPLDVVFLPEDGGSLAIEHSVGGLFEVVLKNDNGRMVTQYIGVTSDGTVIDSGGGQGLGYQGEWVPNPVDEFATVRLNNDAFVAISQNGDDLDATVWERRANGCVLILCDYDSYQLGHNDNDLRPATAGVSVDLPNLTHAYGTSPGTGEQFGRSVVAGDFNGDGFKDLAIGAPGETVNGNEDAGAVTLLFGDTNGPYASVLTQTISQATPGLNGQANEGDLFGYALAVGDFNGDGIDDLAISAPGESIEAENLDEVGIVHVLYGTSNGLSMSTDVILRQGVDGAAGISEEGDQFGWALTTGDFNNDGRDDLGVGIPFEDHNQTGKQDGGAVHVFFGSDSGVATSNDITFHQDSTNMLGSTGAGDEYGYSLATGDSNGDGRDDLFIGIPGKAHFGWEDAGAVHIVRGTNSGLGTNDQLISQDGIVGNNNNSMGDIGESTEEGDRFGESLAVGDFNNDGFADVAISAPKEDHSGFNQAGRIHILHGTASGIDSADEQLIDQAKSGIPSDPQNGSRFGHSLAVGKVYGSEYDDLLVGLPYQDERITDFVSYGNVGAAMLLRGTTNGVSEFGASLVQQGKFGIQDEVDPGDQFGFSLAIADMNGDGFGDAILGAPNESVSKLSDEFSIAGQIHLIFGDGNGLSSSDETWVQGSTKHIRAKLANATWEQQFGVGGGEIYELMPPGTSVPEHVASVTKTMTLLLAVEALGMPNSPIALDDIVTISEKAGTTGGSKMKGTLDGEEVLLEPGDQITLEALLYGMMIPSGNRASVAIAEHVAVNVYGADPGDPEDEESLDEPFNVFVERMNDRAEQIGLDDTRYGHPAGGSTTMPQDLITFWSEASKNPSFRTYAGARAEFPNNPAMTVNTDTPKEFNLQRSSTYVGHDGYKGGQGKVGKVYTEDGELISTAGCDQCHVGSATRAGLQLVVGIQQSGEDFTNAERLYDFGFETLFTPDLRGTNDYQTDLGGVVIAPGTQVMGTINAIAIDHIELGSIVTASIDNQQLQLQLWNANPNLGNILLSKGSIHEFDNLAPGPADARDEKMDVVQLPSTGKILGDYVSAVIDGGNLRLDVWRVGSNYVEPLDFNPGLILLEEIDEDPGVTDSFEIPSKQEPKPIPGDTNGDLLVNFVDFLQLSAKFGERTDAAFADGDFNEDRIVDFIDFLILSNAFGKQPPAHIDLRR